MGLFGPAWMSKSRASRERPSMRSARSPARTSWPKPRAWRRWNRCARRLYLDHRDFPAKYGLKEKAEADYARCEVELEKYKRQTDENMDRIPMDY